MADLLYNISHRFITNLVDSYPLHSFNFFCVHRFPAYPLTKFIQKHVPGASLGNDKEDLSISGIFNSEEGLCHEKNQTFFQ